LGNLRPTVTNPLPKNLTLKEGGLQLRSRASRINSKHQTCPPQPPTVTIEGLEEHQVFTAIGEDGFARLVAAFYSQVPSDEILSPMYPKHDLAGAEQRLRDFLVGRFGGPPRYIEERGHPRLRMRHFPFPIDQAARDRWMRLMSGALEQAALPADATAILREFFEAMSTFMINRPG